MKHIHCPVNAWDCPYYSDKGHPCRCLLEDPLKDCDDFAVFWDEGDDYIDDDWNPCDTCYNIDQDTTDKVACCSCCEHGEFYDEVEEDPFNENDPYVVTNPMAFY